VVEVARAAARLSVLLLAALGCAREPARQLPAARPGGGLRAIDVHTHFGPDSADRAIEILSSHGIDVAINLSGMAPGDGLEEQLAAAARHPGRIIVFTSPRWSLVRAGPGYGAAMAEELARAAALGARGLKISKALGLAVRDDGGRLLAVDAPELDALFERAGQLGMPVAIHTGDPIAFWRRPDANNERAAELAAHPEWSLWGRQVPAWEELQAALERRIARHPGTTFIAVHFGNAPEQPERVAGLLDRHQNLYIDTAARIPEIGRHPAGAMRRLFIEHQDRILFGTDLGVGRELTLGSSGAEPPEAPEVERFFAATWRYFESEERGFAHPTPIQGDWTIDGIHLPPAVLRKVYRDNAARLLHLPP
jgi:predicted TIM-barrel fold metal-dependent hydrolase